MADGNFLPFVWMQDHPGRDGINANGTLSDDGNWKMIGWGGTTDAHPVCFLVGDRYYYAFMYHVINVSCSNLNSWDTNTFRDLGTQYSGNVWYAERPSSYTDAITPYGTYIAWNTLQDALDAYGDYLLPDIPVTYIPTNCTLSGPATVKATRQVTVSVGFESGYGFSSLSDIYVTYNGASVPSTYDPATGILTFTAPSI